MPSPPVAIVTGASRGLGLALARELAARGWRLVVDAHALDELERVYAVNVLAPVALAQLALARMDEGAMILNITSDAAVEAYEGWGGYGSPKAAPEAVPRHLPVEHPHVRVR